jgi:hypothetical protein
MPRSKNDLLLRDFVFQRASYCCEYCRIPLDYSVQPFVLEHIFPVSKQGDNSENNLACSCGGCNGYKASKTEAIDPVNGQKAFLFHPRNHIWVEHFNWDDDFLRIIGISDIGRATVESLKLNRVGLINIRTLLLLVGKHPPLN